MEDGEAVAFDLRKFGLPFVWEMVTKAGATGTHRYALADRPTADDWHEPAQNGTINPDTVANDSEQDPAYWLRWAVAGGGAVVRVFGRGIARIFKTGGGVTYDGPDDFALAVDDVVRIELSEHFAFANGEDTLSYAVATQDSTKVTATVTDGVLTVTAVAAVVDNTVTVTALAPTGETVAGTFDVTVA